MHALLGANGAGKSTLVKVLTGVIRLDEGTILVNGKESSVSSPAQAARIRARAVFQDPGARARPDDRANYYAWRTPSPSTAAAARTRPGDRLRRAGRRRALPLLRMIDLARALARDPQLLILDEITAALPADLAERVFAVMARQKERGRSALFITHRLREVIALHDRATVLRDGGDVGTLIPREGGEEDRRVHARRGSRACRRAGRGDRRSGSGSKSPPTGRRRLRYEAADGRDAHQRLVRGQAG